MTDTCSVDGCEAPRYQQRKMCSSHTMKMHRYGDPHHVPPPRHADLVGQQFGELTVLRRAESRWVCRCICGREVEIRTGDLHRGQATCGDRARHWRYDEVSYTAVHRRLAHDLGKASEYACVDCGSRAAHWSYSNDGADERVDPATGLAYSLDPEDYSPRCVPCHSRYDGVRTTWKDLFAS